MDQYRPEYKAHEHPDINRSVSKEEMKEAIRYAEGLNLKYII